MRKKFIAAAFGGVLAIASANSVTATEIKATVVAGHGTQLPWIRLIKEFYIPEVNKRLKAMGGQHSISWQEAYGGTVTKIGGEIDALRENIADLAFVYTIFEPSRLPLLSVTFMAPFGSPDARQIARIMNELNAELPEMKAQWSNHKTIFLGTVATDSQYLITKFPAKTLDDLKGHKVAAAGSLSLWAAGGGMVPVQGDFATHYNNLKTGVYDGVIAFSTGFYPSKLHQVAPYAMRIDFGSMAMGALAASQTFFDKLPPEVQKVLRDVGLEYSQRVANTLMNVAKTFEGKMQQEGATFTQLPAEDKKRWATTMPNIGKNWVANNQARHVPARNVFSTYLNKLRKDNVTLVRDWDKE
jgi:TRAP-type C4-dicarboxylate transport system substrate-binding protein